MSSSLDQDQKLSAALSSSSSNPSSSDNPSPAARPTIVSPPIDPSKLNHEPAPIPVPHSQADSTDTHPLSPPLRSPNHDNPLDGTPASAYLDTNSSGGPVEPASHPTVAETGVLGSSADGSGPGPKTGQLKRVDGGEKKEGVISLGSFGGEGLMAKPQGETPSSE